MTTYKVISTVTIQNKTIHDKKMNKQQAKATTIQLVKYGLVGVSNSLVTLVVIFLCDEVMGLKLMLADVIGYIAGLINSFIWNKTWVFKSHNKRLHQEAALFIIGFLVCFGLQFITVLLLRDPMKALEINLLGIPSDTFGEYAAICIGMAVYTLCNYAYNRFVTFK